MFDEEALDDLQGIFARIAKDVVGAATNLICRIFDRVDRLTAPELMHMGGSAATFGTHELIEEPYIIVCEVRKRPDEVRVIPVQGAAVKQGTVRSDNQNVRGMFFFDCKKARNHYFCLVSADRIGRL